MMIQKALIIAAGLGSRLAQAGLPAPKPLQKVAGLTLIKRIILLGKRAGLSHFVIVVGYRKDEIIAEVLKENLGVTIEFIENKEWEKPNGVSVLAAREKLQENFVLLMSDHIFDVANLKNLLSCPMRANETVLAVDYKLNTIFDMDDATKVESVDAKVVHIGKTLKNFNAIDTGMFLCTPKLFDALDAAQKNGKFSLSDGIQILAAQNKMGTFDIGTGFWQDVDTKATIKHAEKILLRQCRKPTDGFIARNLNRPISLFITRFIMKTNLSANFLTGCTTFVGMLSGYFVAHADYGFAVLGAFLFKLSSILDGCDGELSRLKLTNSKMGQWLDTLSDNFTYIVFITGLVIGVANTGYPDIRLAGGLTLFGLFMTLAVMFFYLIKNTDSGSLLALQKDFQNAPKENTLQRLIASVQFLLKRDFFALFFFILIVLDARVAVLWLIILGTNTAWIVMLSKSLGLFKKTVIQTQIGK